MEAIFAVSNGVKISLLNIQRNKKYLCNSDCWNSDDCSIKRKCSLRQLKNSWYGTELIINILNASSAAINLSSSAWEMIDSNGYSYGGLSFCEPLQPPRMVDIDQREVSPGTQVKTVLVFPELESGVEISGFLCTYDDVPMRFEIKPLSEEIQSLFAVQEEFELKQVIENDSELRNLRRDLDILKQNVFARFNNVLTPREKNSLDNNVINSEFRIKDKLQKLDPFKRNLFEEEFNGAILQYYDQIDVARRTENKHKELSQKIDMLYELSPREFEEWTASLFSNLGFEKVTLTPQSNDKGIDVLAEKNGAKIAVQCKKYKGIVGSPAIQTFLGAMQNAEVDKGFFITTGTFSFEAEKMALDNPIELYDKIRLIELIEQAMNAQ